MKKYTSFKVLQLAIPGDPYHLKSVSPSETRSETVRIFIRPATILFFVVWVLLLVSFIFPADRF